LQEGHQKDQNEDH